MFSLVALVLVMNQLTDPTSLWNLREFEPAAWRAGDGELRTKMVDDLVDSDRLNGLTAEQVIALLGEPDGRGEEFLFYLDSVSKRDTRIELTQWSDMPHARLRLFVDGELEQRVGLQDDVETVPDSVLAEDVVFELPTADAWLEMSERDRRSALIGIVAAFAAERIDAASLRAWHPSGRVDHATLMYDLEFARYYCLFIKLVDGRVDHAGVFKSIDQGLID